MVLIIESLLALLRGGTLDPLPVEPPTMLPAVLPRGVRALFASLRESYRIKRQERELLRSHRLVTLGRDAGRFGPIAVRFHAVPVGMGALKKAASARKCSVTALVMGALAMAFAEGSPPESKPAVAVRLSVDLRKYYPEGRAPTFGNYVATFLVIATSFGPKLVGDIAAQLKEGLARFERKLMSYPLLVAEAFSRLGRAILRIGAVAGKRRGTLPPMTCHYSNLGNVDAWNAGAETHRLREVLPIAPNVGPFVVTAGLGDAMALTMSHAKDEATRAELDAFLAAFDRALVAIADVGAQTTDSQAVRIAS